ncbi:MAG: tRNA 4-thiouridine(8) synthase ThiI [Gemmatimonadetes bacterium]|nr:tRNA 4-thiouridine(8) synthase ThiI [Gemmatimonadota bacterium]NIO32554.1 tRNA 4-thiouridine(8) synthase ThiI [Gemmatimonadota bacterium]
MVNGTTLEHLILLRPSGELATKSRHTRRRFQRSLVAALEDALAAAGTSYEVQDDWGRLYVRASSRAALDVVARVYGIASLSEVEATTEASLDSIVEVGERVYADRVRGGTFGVRARRSGKHSFSSRDVNYQLGAALNRYAEVDLGDPDVAVGVEVRDETAYFYSKQFPGAGGLPAGVEGPAVALVSGGYDSAVAAWMMLKRGVALDYVFCNLGGGAYERAVLAVAKLLADEWSYGLSPKMHVVDFAEPVLQLRERVRESYWQVVLKRLMYRTADLIARENGAHAIVTGESVGQVSSQTLANLAAIDRSAVTPVLRPLVGFDKGEIINQSRKIGTYPLSEKVREYCALTELRPVTEAAPADAASEEAQLDLSVLESAVEGRRVLALRDLDPSELMMPYLYTSEIAAAAIVLDTRSAAQYDAWHYPGARHCDFWDLFRDLRSLEKERTYVLYCDLGLKTAQLAEKMQQAGYEAYSFKGGVRALRNYVEALGRT